MGMWAQSHSKVQHYSQLLVEVWDALRQFDCCNKEKYWTKTVTKTLLFPSLGFKNKNSPSGWQPIEAAQKQNVVNHETCSACEREKHPCRCRPEPAFQVNWYAAVVTACGKWADTKFRIHECIVLIVQIFHLFVMFYRRFILSPLLPSRQSATESVECLLELVRFVEMLDVSSKTFD